MLSNWVGLVTFLAGFARSGTNCASDPQCPLSSYLKIHSFLPICFPSWVCRYVSFSLSVCSTTVTALEFPKLTGTAGKQNSYLEKYCSTHTVGSGSVWMITSTWPSSRAVFKTVCFKNPSQASPYITEAVFSLCLPGHMPRNTRACLEFAYNFCFWYLCFLLVPHSTNRVYFWHMCSFTSRPKILPQKAQLLFRSFFFSAHGKDSVSFYLYYSLVVELAVLG